MLNSSLSRTTHTMTIWPGFCTIKNWECFYFPLDGIPVHRSPLPSPVTPSPPHPQYICRKPFIHLGAVKHHDSNVSCTKTRHNDPNRACTRTFSIRCQYSNHWVTAPPICYLMYLGEPPYLHFKTMVVKVPVHNDREDVSHRLCAKRVNRDDVKMSQKSRSDFVSPSSGRTHGRH